MSVYHAIILPEGQSAIHRRISLEANSLDDAKQRIEAEHGLGVIVSLWGEWEAQQARDAVGREK